MNIELNDLLTIENKEYVVSYITKFNECEYFYFVNIENPLDYKFCYKINNQIYEEYDKNKISRLILLINKELSQR